MNDWMNLFDLNDVCTIKRVVYINDSYCNISTQWSTIASNEPCAFWQTAGNEIVVGDRIVNPISAQLAIKPSTEYRPTDHIVVRGSTYTVGNPHNVANEDAIMVFNLESIE